MGNERQDRSSSARAGASPWCDCSRRGMAASRKKPDSAATAAIVIGVLIGCLRLASEVPDAVPALAAVAGIASAVASAPIALAVRLAESGAVPDVLLRAGIRFFCRRGCLKSVVSVSEQAFALSCLRSSVSLPMPSKDVMAVVGLRLFFQSELQKCERASGVETQPEEQATNNSLSACMPGQHGTYSGLLFTECWPRAMPIASEQLLCNAGRQTLKNCGVAAAALDGSHTAAPPIPTGCRQRLAEITKSSVDEQRAYEQARSSSGDVARS
eukprot:6180752-Pleurochrysis_carterae.AAC.1